MSRRPNDPRYEETRAEPRGRHAAETEPEAQRHAGAREPDGNGSQRTQARSAPAAQSQARPSPETGLVAYGNGPGIASLVLGLLSVTLAFLVFPVVAAVLLGIAAIICGVIGIRNANRLAGLHKGLAVTGLVTGVLAVLMSAAIIAGGVAIFDQMGDQLQVDELREQLPDGG